MNRYFLWALTGLLALTASTGRSAAPPATRPAGPPPAAPAEWLAAARAGDTSALKRMLAQTPELVRSADFDGRTALHLAIAGRHPAAMTALLEAGADPRQADRAALTPMRLASQCGDEDLATDFLIAVGGMDIFEAIRLNDVDAAAVILVGDCDVIRRRRNGYESAPVYYAVRQDRAEILRLLLGAGAGQKDHYEPLLAEAAEAGSLECVKLLVTRGFDVNVQSDMGGPLQRAASANRADIVEVLLGAGAKVDVVSEHEDSPLASAAWHGNLALCHRLLEAGAEVDFPADWGWRPVHAALWAGRAEAAALLLERGAKVDAFAAAGLGRLEELKKLMARPLDAAFEKSIAPHPAYFAARCGQAKVLAWLLDEGVSAKLTDKHRRFSLLHHAAWGGDVETIRLLLGRGADPNAASEYDGPPLAFAVLNSKFEACEALLRAGASLNDGGKGGSPLTCATEAGNLAGCRFLLDRGADVHGGDQDNLPLPRAAMTRRVEIVRLLLERGADARRGRALADAAHTGSAEIVRLLLDKGADPNQPDGDHTPLEAAAWGSARADIARMLVQAGARVPPDRNDIMSIYLGVLGDRKVVEALVERGLDIKFASNRASANGMPSMWAAAVRFGRVDLMRLLMDRGAPLGPRSPHDRESAPLHVAAEAGSRPAMRMLLRAGAGTGSDPSYYGPLHAATERDHVGVLRLLAPRPRELPREQLKSVLQRAGGSLGGLRVLRWLAESGVLEDQELAMEALEAALRYNRVDALQALLAGGISVNVKKDKATLLHLALRNSLVDAGIVETLLRGGAEVNVRDEGGLTPLHLAILRNRYDLARRLVQADASLDAHTAAALGRMEVLIEAVGRDRGVVRVNLGLGQPLHWAAHGGHVAAVRFLLDHKADVNTQPPPPGHIRNIPRPTPLGYAAMNKHLEVARMLLAAGADPNARPPANSPPAPLHHAVMNHQEAMVRLLLDFEADIEAEMYHSKWRPIHLAASHALPEILRMLSSAGADLTATADGKHTPLSLAADETNYGGYGSNEPQEEIRRRRPAAVNALLDEYARRKIPPPTEGLAAVLVWACGAGEFDLVRRGVELGADVNGGGERQYSPLMAAVGAISQGREEDLERMRPVRLQIIRFLLEQGANPNQGARNLSALQLAERNQDKEVLDLLRTVKKQPQPDGAAQESGVPATRPVRIEQP